MNTMGMAWPEVAKWVCNSSPVMPGIRTSRTSRSGSFVWSSSKNFCAEPYVFTLNPADFINLPNALQTEGSSSTTQTVGSLWITVHLCLTIRSSCLNSGVRIRTIRPNSALLTRFLTFLLHQILRHISSSEFWQDYNRKEWGETIGPWSNPYRTLVQYRFEFALKLAGFFSHPDQIRQ